MLVSCYVIHKPYNFLSSSFKETFLVELLNKLTTNIEI